MNENITKADQTTALLVSDLQQALRQATAVESIVLLQMIYDASELQRRISEFAAAVSNDSAMKDA